MKFKAKRYYGCKDDLKQFHFQLKQTPCPHCRSIGFLNLHGFLRGYDEHDCCKKGIRGRRIFCNNRGRRTGCGRTFSILAARILKKFMISAQTFWLFLKYILAGRPAIQAFQAADTTLARSSCYRLWKRFRLRQSTIRTKLLNLCPAPMNSLTHLPHLQTIMHMKTAFTSPSCPITAFQNHFQVRFL
jgi:hypothetical protein